MKREFIVIEGARQNKSAKNVSIKLPLNALIAITGVSGSGKSSLAFDTIYAEGQRRYIETFSPMPASSSTGWTNQRWIASPASRRRGHRSNQPGAHLAVHGRHHDRDQRFVETPLARAAGLYCRGCGKPVQPRFGRHHLCPAARSLGTRGSGAAAHDADHL